MNRYKCASCEKTSTEEEWVKPSIGELLWIKYDYETEKFDKQLSHVIKDGTVYPIGADLLISQSNASNWYDWLQLMRKKYDVSNKELHNAKTSSIRGKTTEESIKLYEDLKKRGHYNFLLNEK